MQDREGLVAPRVLRPGVDPGYIASGASRAGVPYTVWLKDRAKGAEPAADAEPSAEERKKLAELKRAIDSGAVDPRRLAGLQLRDTDPLMHPSPAVTPGDFANEFGTPIDTTEIIALCEELGLYSALPEVLNGSKVDSWRELTQLEFASGCDACAFPAGECPEDMVHHTDTEAINKKHIGVKKSLTESDIRHSMAAIAGGVGVSSLIGGFNEQGLPGELDAASLLRGGVTDLKEKELRLGMILTLNCWDDLLVNGDATTNPIEFDGITNLITAVAGARACPTWMTGTFAVADFDRFLSAGCAHPQAILGHPTALAEIAAGYMAIGYQAIVHQATDVPGAGQRVVPGMSFASEIMTGVGPLALIGDTRFPRVDNADGTFRTIVYPVRLTHNGEPLIYKSTQIALSAKELPPGCTAIALEVWAVTALVVKAMCAQALCEMDFSGLVDDGCAYVHPCTPESLP